MALLLAAMVHDMGHDGCNNQFHKNSLSARCVVLLCDIDVRESSTETRSMALLPAAEVHDIGHD